MENRGREFSMFALYLYGRVLLALHTALCMQVCPLCVVCLFCLFRACWVDSVCSLCYGCIYVVCCYFLSVLAALCACWLRFECGLCLLDKYCERYVHQSSSKVFPNAANFQFSSVASF